MAQQGNGKSSIFHEVEDLIKGDYRTFAEVLLYYSNNYKNDKLAEVKSTLLEAAERGGMVCKSSTRKIRPPHNRLVKKPRSRFTKIPSTW